MVRPAGLEPATWPLARARSIQLSYGRIVATDRLATGDLSTEALFSRLGYRHHRDKGLSL